MYTARSSVYASCFCHVTLHSFEYTPTMQVCMYTYTKVVLAIGEQLNSDTGVFIWGSRCTAVRINFISIIIHATVSSETKALVY